LIPLSETAARLVRDLPLLAGRPKQPTLGEALAELLQPRLGVKIDPALWSSKALPDHLRVRVEVVDNRGAVLCASRDLDEIKKLLHGRQREVSQQAASKENAAWRAAREKWEGEPATEWKFGDLPASVVVEEKHGLPVLAYPGLKALPAGVAVRLFAAPEPATAATRSGLEKLFEAQLRHDLGWLEKDLKALRMIGPLAVTLVSIDQLQADALESIRRWVCDADRVGRAATPLAAEGSRRGAESAPYLLTAANFKKAIDAAKQDLRGLVSKLGDWLKEVFNLRLELETHAQPYPNMAQDLAALLPPDFLRRTPFERVKHLPRYLRGMKARAERWKRDAAKDSQRAAELAPFVAAVKKGGPQAAELRWLVEEFRVSLFAQELGTAEPVSAVRLQRALDELSGVKTAAAPAPAPAIVPTTLKKGPPLKSLGSLDQLFRK
jgi:ATP-dependent helicase HrpA